MPSKHEQTSVSHFFESTEARNLPVIEEANAFPDIGHLYARFRSSFGRPNVPGILKCFATHPPLLEHMLGVAESVLFVDGALSRKQKELISTFVSARNNCEYCADSHGASLRAQGASEPMVSAALSCDPGSASLSPAENAMLAFVQQITDDSASVSPATIAIMRGEGWTDLQIAEAIHLAALFACFNRVANAFGLPSQGLLAGAGRD